MTLKPQFLLEKFLLFQHHLHIFFLCHYVIFDNCDHNFQRFKYPCANRLFFRSDSNFYFLNDIIFCSSFVFLPDGYFYSYYSPKPTGWFHVVLNYIVDVGDAMYINGTEVMRATNWYDEYNFSAGDGRIVVGKRQTDANQDFASVQVDELIFFNQALTDEEIKSIYNSAY